MSAEPATSELHPVHRRVLADHDVKPDDLVDAYKASEILGLSYKALSQRRLAGDAPPWVKKPGRRRIWYRVADLLDLVEVRG